MDERKAMLPKTKAQELEEKLNILENRVQLLEIIAKAGTQQQLAEMPKTKKVIQINAYKGGRGEKYFCMTQQEQSIFAENNPGVKTETFKVELPDYVANERLNDPENKKQFVKKVKVG